MTKLHTPYHVAEDNVTVTFTEVKNGVITGTYPWLAYNCNAGPYEVNVFKYSQV